jgi:hypothetical protein
MGREVEVIVSFGGLHEKHAVQRGVLVATIVRCILSLE